MQNEKGMQGIDSRVRNPRNKGARLRPARPPGAGCAAAAVSLDGWSWPEPAAMRCRPGGICRDGWARVRAGQAAYVVTFGRAGEDNKKFKLGDVEQTLAGFAGADYDLQASWFAACCFLKEGACATRWPLLCTVCASALSSWTIAALRARHVHERVHCRDLVKCTYGDRMLAVHLHAERAHKVALTVTGLRAGRLD